MMSPRLSRSPRSFRDDRRCSLLVYLAILDASLRNMRMHLSSSLSLSSTTLRLISRRFAVSIYPRMKLLHLSLSASRGVDLLEDENHFTPLSGPELSSTSIKERSLLTWTNAKSTAGGSSSGSAATGGWLAGAVLMARMVLALVALCFERKKDDFALISLVLWLKI
ncbi:hypothetical protein F2Q69_00031497 [Brassica cretica]|uniref:Uncharacterized protein n=1 Tax=Brassica cretica TaxID=69181 RepID=A0A8S9S5L2_BRACR|nr:hypothetical protein F2Q69_00031497 [Brassica cretica]